MKILNDQTEEWFWSKMPQTRKWKKMSSFWGQIFWKNKFTLFDDEDMLWRWLMVVICWQVDLSTRWWWVISLSSFVAGPLRLKSPYGEVEGGVDVAHVVEQADLGGRVVGVGRRLGAGDRGAGLKENLRRLRRFGGLRWLYLGFWLVWLSWPGLPPGPSSSAPV